MTMIRWEAFARKLLQLLKLLRPEWEKVADVRKEGEASVVEFGIYIDIL